MEFQNKRLLEPKGSGINKAKIDHLVTHFSNNSPIRRILKPTDIAPILEFLISKRYFPLRNEKIVIDGDNPIVISVIFTQVNINQ